MKGKTPWNKGKTSLKPAWNKGQKLSEEHRKNLLRAKKATTACKNCGIEMIVNESRITAGRGSFCSRQCLGKVAHLGKFHTEDAKRKIGAGNKNIPRTEEQKDFLRKLRLGKKNPNGAGEKCHFWKGGITPINMAIRNSLEYKLWRTAVFERDGYTCIWGGKEHGNKLNADHIKPFALFPELRFTIDNGRTLCVECHRKTDTYGGKSIRK